MLIPCGWHGCSHSKQAVCLLHTRKKLTIRVCMFRGVLGLEIRCFFSHLFCCWRVTFLLLSILHTVPHNLCAWPVRYRTSCLINTVSLSLLSKHQNSIFLGTGLGRLAKEKRVERWPAFLLQQPCRMCTRSTAKLLRHGGVLTAKCWDVALLQTELSRQHKAEIEALNWEIFNCSLN